LIEELRERENCKQALKRVKANKGSPEVDGMTVQQRDADDSNIYVRRRRAGERVMESITRFLSESSSSR
jgi:hypothetical protein